MDSRMINRCIRGGECEADWTTCFHSDSNKTPLAQLSHTTVSTTAAKQWTNLVLKAPNWSHHRHTSTFRHRILLKLCKLLNEFNAASTTALIIITISRLLFQSELQKAASEGRKERRFSSEDNRNIYIPSHQRKKQQSLCKTYHNVGNSIIPLQVLRKCRRISIPTLISTLALGLQNFSSLLSFFRKTKNHR